MYIYIYMNVDNSRKSYNTKRRNYHLKESLKSKKRKSDLDHKTLDVLTVSHFI